MTRFYYTDSGTGEHSPFATRAWRGASGQPLELGGLPPFDVQAIDPSVWSLWRYRAMLPLPADAAPVSLGEGMTPLVPLAVDDRVVHFKLEFVGPTGSYKDRGVTTLVSGLRAIGVAEVIEDSSGNAGTAVAAYAAAAGLRARIFVPDYAPAAKKAQIRVYGAQLEEIGGGRAATTDAAVRAAATSMYASHAWHPLFTSGLRTAAWEVWEQLGRRPPDAVLTPVGQGGLYLGFYLGFRDLLAAGLIRQMPRLYGVQAQAVSPVAQAWAAGQAEVAAVSEGRSIADGVLIRQPVRGGQLLQAARETGGGFLAADDAAVARARTDLARHGLFVEPTSALVLAGRRALGGTLPRDAVVVAALTGAGLKSPPTS